MLRKIISLISMLIMNRPSAGIVPVCFSYFLVIILLCEFTRPVQSIALSSLCAHFGHSCFGGNWGKRELSTSSSTQDFSQSNFDRTHDGTAIYPVSDENSMNNFLLEQIRLNLFRQRLRQLFE